MIPLAKRAVVDLVGPVCESGDFFARDREMPEVKEGDLVAILDAGAYGMSLSSNYNSRPRAAEVLVEGKKARLIRRRETIRDLIQPEIRCSNRSKFWIVAHVQEDNTPSSGREKAVLRNSSRFT